MKTETERKVTAIMDMYDELDQRKYVGDYTALDYLDEFDEAVRDADLTDKQSEILSLFIKGYSQTDISEMIDVPYKTVHTIKTRLVTKIAKQYRNEES